jgi:GcrA cell cycle regulator
MSDFYDWTPERVQRLRVLWDEGHSTAEIGRRLGVSKNAVVGKSRRIGGLARPSPIVRDGAAPPPKRAPRVTLPALVFAKVPQAAVAGDGAAQPAEVPVHEVVAKPGRVSRPCCWPIGEPRAPDFRFCEDPGVPGRSYCAAHESLAWDRRPRDMSAAQREAAVERRMRAYERAATGTGRHGLGFIISGGGL